MELLRKELRKLYDQYVKRIKEAQGDPAKIEKATQWYRTARANARKPESFLKRRYDAWKRAKETQYELEDTQKALQRAVDSLSQEIASLSERSAHLLRNHPAELKECEDARREAQAALAAYAECRRSHARAIKSSLGRVRSLQTLLAMLRHIQRVFRGIPTEKGRTEYAKSTGGVWVSPELKHLSMVADSWPGLAFIKMLYEISHGKDMITGQPIPKVSRALMLLFLLPSIVGLGGPLSRLAKKIGKWKVVNLLGRLLARVWGGTKIIAKEAWGMLASAYRSIKNLLFGSTTIRTARIRRTPLTNRELLEMGITPLQKKWLHWVAKKENVRIILRAATRKAIEKITKGAVPKPWFVKAKGVNPHDLFLNPSLNKQHVGLVAHFVPVSADKVKAAMQAAGIKPASSQWKAILRRRESRLENYRLFKKDLKEMQGGKFLTVGGKKLPAAKVKVADRTGLVSVEKITSSGKKYMPVASDLDLFQIIDQAGRQLGEGSFLYDMVIRLLSHAPTRVQHGAITAWSPGGKYSQFAKDIIKDHVLKWNWKNGRFVPGAKEPLVIFGANSAHLGAAKVR